MGISAQPVMLNQSDNSAQRQNRHPMKGRGYRRKHHVIDESPGAFIGAKKRRRLPPQHCGFYAGQPAPLAIQHSIRPILVVTDSRYRMWQMNRPRHIRKKYTTSVPAENAATI